MDSTAERLAFHHAPRLLETIYGKILSNKGLCPELVAKITMEYELQKRRAWLKELSTHSNEVRCYLIRAKTHNDWWFEFDDTNLVRIITKGSERAFVFHILKKNRDTRFVTQCCRTHNGKIKFYEGKTDAFTKYVNEPEDGSDYDDTDYDALEGDIEGVDKFVNLG